ncbi:MAG: hypothetical protein EOM80_01390 [Erysipelotrichia bacterium]|nr:hypothetical protein [Erysipelotrichia bacterium]
MLNPMLRIKKSASQELLAMQEDPQFKFSELLQTAGKHRFIGLCCLVLCVFLESWVAVYPPRGVAGEDVILIGSVMGSPLVRFEPLWLRMFNDDEFMLQVVERSGICKNTEKSEQLRFLNRTVRKNLKFCAENDTLIKISFKRPGYNDIRPFLNYFTEGLVQKLKLMSQEEFALRKEKARLQFVRIVERLRLVARVFRLPEIHKLLVDNGSILPGGKLLLASEPESLRAEIGGLLINELLPPYYMAATTYEQYFKDNLEILNLYPRFPILLTSRDTPAMPVQPFYEMIFLLVPISVLLIYLALLIILRHKDLLASRQ